MVSAPRVLVDANLLYRTRLRELLLALAKTGLIAPFWSRRIIEETASGLVRSGRLNPAERDAFTASLADPAFMVVDYEQSEGSFGLPDRDDEHVLAAAVHAGAPTILTFNLKDFPPRCLKPVGIRAQMPDAFFLGLFSQTPETFLKAIEGARLTIAPNISVEEHLVMLRRAGLSRTIKQYQRQEATVAFAPASRNHSAVGNQ